MLYECMNISKELESVGFTERVNLCVSVHEAAKRAIDLDEKYSSEESRGC